jgi:hypothetical protein
MGMQQIAGMQVLSVQALRSQIASRGFRRGGWTLANRNSSAFMPEHASAVRGIGMHKFQVGQSVDLIPSIVRRAAKGTYEIIRLIPDSDDDPQYRVKSAAEPHERVVPESQLELSAKQASLLS